MSLVLAISAVSLIVMLLVWLGFPKLLSSRFAVLEGRLSSLEKLETAAIETSIHAREAKEAASRVAESFSQFEGRFAGVSAQLNLVTELMGSLQPAVETLIVQGLVQFKGSITAEHATMRAELTDRDNRNARNLTDNVASGFQTIASSLAEMRQETHALLKGSSDSFAHSMTELRSVNDANLGEIVTRTTESASTLNQTAQQSIATVADRLAHMTTAPETALKAELGALRTDNTVALEAMRVTVDEKLQTTLEAPLGSSFQLVSKQLEDVYRGLGEMQTLAVGVGDLRKVLTNVKTRGPWGEVQLETLLDQMLTLEQYAKNVATKRGSNARVEFAIRLPGRSESGHIWLPIDAKFPLEDYQRLVDAQDLGDVAAVEEASRALETRIKAEAKSIREKYIEAPATRISRFFTCRPRDCMRRSYGALGLPIRCSGSARFSSVDR